MRFQHDPTGRRVPTVTLAASRNRKRTAALLLAGVGILVTACGTTSSTSTTSTPTTSAPTTPTAAAPGTTSPTSGSSTTSTTSGPKTNGCATSDLSISIGNPNGTAGAIHYILTYRNNGASACTLFGYPGVSFLAADGSQIGSPAQRSSGDSVLSVIVAPGANAYSGVSVTDPGIPPCASSGTATRVRVFPPGETHAAIVAAPSGFAVCSSPNTPNYRSAIIGPLVSSTS